MNVEDYIYETINVDNVDDYVLATKIGYVSITLNEKKLMPKVIKRLKREQKNEQGYRDCLYKLIDLKLNSFIENGNKKKNKKLFNKIKKLTSTDHSMPLLFLGKCYQYGIGVEINVDKARYLYGKAANKGNAVAQYYLGKVDNTTNKLSYFEQSSAKGYEIATNELHIKTNNKYEKWDCFIKNEAK